MLIQRIDRKVGLAKGALTIALFEYTLMFNRNEEETERVLTGYRGIAVDSPSGPSSHQVL